jgi:hypothetical protein
MKLLLAAALMLALGIGQSAAQTGAPSSGGMVSAPSSGGMGATSPLGADFSRIPGNSQSAVVPYSGTVNPAPCSTGNPSTAALPIFDGAGFNLSTSSAASGLPGNPAAGARTSAPCNSVSSSGVVTAPNSAVTTAPSANSSSSSSASSSLESPMAAAASGSPNTASLGVTALGTGGLGTTALGTTGLGSVPTQPSTLQTSTSPSTATQSETSCSGDLGTPPASTVTAQSLSGGVPNPAQSLRGSTTDAARRLGGTATVPVTPVPCPTTSTTSTIP